MATADPTHTGYVLASTLGVLMGGGTILGLAWDWYRHPDLQAVHPVLARRPEAAASSLASSTQSTPVASAT